MSTKTEEGQAEQAEATPTAGHSKKKLLLISGGILLLVVLVAAPAMFLLKGSKEKKVEEVAPDAAAESEVALPEGHDDEEELEEGEEPLGAMFPLEAFVVNVNDGGFLRCQIHLEFSERDLPKKLYGRVVIVRDGIIKILGSRNRADLLTEKGKDAVKASIREMTNEILGRQAVKRVFFSQYVVQ